MSDTQLKDLSDEELEQLRVTLAEERTRIRHMQNNVQAEQEIRQLLKGLSGATRETVRIRLEGGIRPTGGVEA